MARDQCAGQPPFGGQPRRDQGRWLSSGHVFGRGEAGGRVQDLLRRTQPRGFGRVRQMKRFSGFNLIGEAFRSHVKRRIYKKNLKYVVLRKKKSHF